MLLLLFIPIGKFLVLSGICCLDNLGAQEDLVDMLLISEPEDTPIPPLAIGSFGYDPLGLIRAHVTQHPAMSCQFCLIVISC